MIYNRYLRTLYFLGTTKKRSIIVLYFDDKDFFIIDIRTTI